MTNQQRNSTGYRGALPPRNDRLAAPWVLAVVIVFLLMFVLAFLGLPSALFPEPTPLPSINPSIPVSSIAPSGSVAP
ncbi:MAG TPA: hypothetical protein VK838_06625 [Candidatus Limnocylindrales bacterium]|nr:hypothetical protein [Candidatus Limnocylindrales bacterium]